MPKLTLVARIAICLLLGFLPLTSLDRWFYDQIFRLRGRQLQKTDYLLVRVNDAKLYPLIENASPLVQESLLFSPKTHALWVGEFYQTLLERVSSGNPKLIAFTTFFRVIDEVPEVHLSDDSSIIFASAINEQQQVIPPPKGLINQDNFGFANLFPDTDSLVRRTNLVYSSGNSLALRIYHRLFETPIERNLLEPLWIDYRGPEGTYPSVDGWELAQGNVDPSVFEGKIVLIGKQGSPVTDFETPFGKMSALEIQANAVDTFIQSREIKILPRYVTWILALAAVVVSVTIILLFPLTLAWLFLLLLSVMIILVTLLAFSQFKIWWGVANPIFCIFGTHLVMLGYKLNRQEEQQWKLQQESEVLRELDEFKNNFISLFSHDLKTPISKIKAITGRLLGSYPELPSEVKESLISIERTNNELARLIFDILKVTKMESMSIDLKTEVIDLNRLVEVAVKRLAFQADEKNITVISDLEPLFSMEGDPNLLAEVITNLLENAIKYSPNDSTVIIRTTEEEGFVRVEVSDSGPGIPLDELPRVTGKFYRGKGATDTTKGSGLGLYLSKYFVELHQGQLEISSQQGQGTVVKFTLPLGS